MRASRGVLGQLVAMMVQAWDASVVGSQGYETAMIQGAMSREVLAVRLVLSMVARMALQMLALEMPRAHRASNQFFQQTAQPASRQRPPSRRKWPRQQYSTSEKGRDTLGQP